MTQPAISEWKDMGDDITYHAFVNVSAQTMVDYCEKVEGMNPSLREIIYNIAVYARDATEL